MGQHMRVKLTSEDRHILERLERHYTPEHASWLNMRPGPTG